MLGISILLFFIVCLLLYFIRNDNRRIQLINQLPGPPGIPILGNVLSFLLPPDAMWSLIRAMNDKYYPTYKISTPEWYVINIRHPDDAEILLTSSRHITKSAVYDFLHPLFQTGLLTSTGKKWQQRRKILTPAFHFNVLRQFVAVFDQEGRRMVEDINSSKNINDDDLIPLVTKYTLNTICETAMGTSIEGTASFYSKYRRAIHDMGIFIVHRLVRPWIHMDFLFALSPTGRKQKKALEIIHSFSTKIIRERQNYHEKYEESSSKEDGYRKVETDEERRPAMLDLLIQAMKEGNIDESGIREEVDTFIFEGHDTTGMGMTFTLLLLAEHKDYQTKAREEIDSVLKESNGRMEITEIQRFAYLERCIKETLRLYPSVPFISREVGEELRLKNYILPKGVVAHLHIYDLHRDPKFWPDPHTFDPDRFLPERIVGRHPFSYIPFSAGQRNCIGQKFAMLELKAIIGHLLHNFYLEPIDVASKVVLISDLVIRPKGSVRIKFVPREKKL